jgi:hypothetical protein
MERGKVVLLAKYYFRLMLISIFTHPNQLEREKKKLREEMGLDD